MNKVRLATYLANAADHFDNSLYGFLVPLLAPWFFDASDPATGLIKGYGLLLLGIVARPLGAWRFAKIAHRKSPRQALIEATWGMTAATFAFVFVHPFEAWGAWSAIALCVLKTAQNFFAAGETSVANLYVFENADGKERLPVAGFFLSGTMIGIGLASLAASALFYSPCPEKYWKIPFFLSALTGLSARLLRRQTTPEEVSRRDFTIDWGMVFKIVPITALYYMTYSAPIVFFNGFANLLTARPLDELMATNAAFIAFDAAVAIFFGKAFRDFSPITLLKIASYACIAVMPAAFASIPGASAITLIIVRATMIIVGVAFSVPLYSYLFAILPKESRYATSAIGYAIGSEAFGRSFPFVGFFLWKATGLVVAPAIYVCLMAALTLVALISIPPRAREPDQ